MWTSCDLDYVVWKSLWFGIVCELDYIVFVLDWDVNGVITMVTATVITIMWLQLWLQLCDYNCVITTVTATVWLQLHDYNCVITTMWLQLWLQLLWFGKLVIWSGWFGKVCDLEESLIRTTPTGINHLWHWNFSYVIMIVTIHQSVKWMSSKIWSSQ